MAKKNRKRTATESRRLAIARLTVAAYDALTMLEAHGIRSGDVHDALAGGIAGVVGEAIVEERVENLRDYVLDLDAEEARARGEYPESAADRAIAETCANLNVFGS